MLALLLAVFFRAANAGKCIDRVIHSDYVHHSQGLAVTMNWRSSLGDNCLDYELFGYCKPDGSKDLGWPYDGLSFADVGADGFDATTACCACGGGEMKADEATPAPTSAINTLGKYPGKDDAPIA